MMGRFEVGLARADDDEQLMAIQSMPMEGSINISYQRSPSIFTSIGLLGYQNEIIVMRDTKTDKIAGYGVRSLRKVYINGELTDVGYLSGLRSHEEYRGSVLLARAYAYLRELPDQTPVPLYFTTIIEGNEVALPVLTSGRAGLPIYQDAGRYTTYALGGAQRRKLSRRLKIIRGCRDTLPQIVDFLNKESSRFQFGPHYEASELLGGTQYLGFSLDDMYVAYDNDECVGVLAMWDQSFCKQNVVSGYSDGIKRVRWAYNLAARIGQNPQLPPEGDKILHYYLALLAVRDDSQEVFESLLGEVRESNSYLGNDYMIIGMHEDNPLSLVLQKDHPITYHSRLFTVFWEDGRRAYEALDKRIPHVEVSSL
jgi:hypothetical protein